MPKAGLPTGTQIRNVATVTFDVNPPITTDQVNENDPSQGVDPAKQDLNTIDAVRPDQQRHRAAGLQPRQLHRELVRPGRLRAAPASIPSTFTCPTTAATSRSGRATRPPRRPPLRGWTATPTASTAWPSITPATSSRAHGRTGHDDRRRRSADEQRAGVAGLQPRHLHGELVRRRRQRVGHRRLRRLRLR